jgi:hypothetical protein
MDFISIFIFIKIIKKKEIMDENYKLFYYLIQKVFFFLRKVLFKKLGFFYVFVVETLA